MGKIVFFSISTFLNLVFFGITGILTFILDTLLLVKVTWFILLLLNIIIPVILKKNKFIKLFIIESVSFAFLFRLISDYRVENDVSFLGATLREILRFVLLLPPFSGSKIFTLGIENCSLTNWSAPDNFTYQKIDIDGLPIEILKNNESNSKKAILQLHGGGYLMCLSDVYRGNALRLSNETDDKRTVISIDYKIAPNYVFPAALDDAYNAWNWIIKNGYKEEDIIIIGDSAGGNLALSLTAKLRDEKKKLPAGLILISPWTDMSSSGDSYQENKYEDLLFGIPKKLKNNPLVLMRPGTEILFSYAGNTDLKDKFLSPIYNDYNDFPPMLFQVGDREILKSDSVTVYNKAKNSGVKDVKLTIFKGMFHVFQLIGLNFAERVQAWKEIHNFLNTH